ncbi:hypothetical protein FOB58_005802 [Candida parapsilosis]|uniref:Cyclin-D1-binding protein 1-like N-terminal domain-containing protein n=2 Tax=Candida parapsilosis TaxID=5480 RepID=G8BK42_CANPC|nr:uncharacterized protein CPAR2_701110 [Candida parapsilosis]KAF6041734.1 hypothetical protein FOB58_005802 [Candida parapsilosis]KAF6041887.1 hypothetical protein FOB59_005780 [Candida parapsilosis]KAF6042598.1 hypothetical protein FOB60_005797 [Candida parapsilosis]KAF6058376.1 hypothetical protein FOB61_005537 [Candida parapsilosis]KAI5907413.1 hypothetical protein K4G61_g1074 [Candida parapsilosis]
MSNDLKALLASFKDATQYWITNLTSEQISQIKASKVDNPLDELSKLVKLIKAHVTKVGIIFKPETLAKQESTAYTTLEKLSESLILLVSVVSQLQAKQISNLFYNEIVHQVRQLIESNHELANELTYIYDEKEDSARLVSVGKIWSNCDSLTTLINNGALNLLTSKIKQSIGLIDDGFEEFVEWVENPVDIDDPFGLSDDEEHEDDEEKLNSEVESDDEEHSAELKAYAEKSLKEIELVKLLLASFKKSLPKTTTGLQVDEINNLQKTITNLIDKLIVDLMLNREITKEVESISKDISIYSVKLAKLAKSIHTDKKSAWYTTWITKFN